jgi:F-type H+-transporting ATPase subunit a
MIKKILVILFSLCLSFSVFANENGHESEAFDLPGIIDHHLYDHAEFPLNFGGVKVYEGEANFDKTNPAIFEDHIEGNLTKKYHFVGGFDMHITRRVTMMWIVTFFLLITFIPAARMIANNPLKVHSRFTGAVETVLEYLRKEVIDPNMHGHGHPYYHYLFSLFFFILFCNLFGLIPSIGEILALVTGQDPHHSVLTKIWSGITVTGDVSVTVTLAGSTLFLIYGTGFAYQGIRFIPNSVPNGVPWPLWPLLWPLEFIISPIAKAFALTVRLLANMTAGHVVILALLGFIFEFRSYAIVPISIGGATAIYLLEIFVAFVQAFIFTLLTSLFVGSSMHRH